MKRKEAMDKFTHIAALTLKTDGFMNVRDDETGEEFDVCVPFALAVARGTLEWAIYELDCGDPDETERKSMQSMLASVARSINLYVQGGGR